MQRNLLTWTIPLPIVPLVPLVQVFRVLPGSQALRRLEEICI